MKQLTWRDAETLAAKAAMKAIGFGPTSGKITVDASEVMRVAQSAAIIALRENGCLAANDAREEKLRDLQVEAAEKRQRAFESRR